MKSKGKGQISIVVFTSPLLEFPKLLDSSPNGVCAMKSRSSIGGSHSLVNLLMYA